MIEVEFEVEGDPWDYEFELIDPRRAHPGGEGRRRHRARYLVGVEEEVDDD